MVYHQGLTQCTRWLGCEQSKQADVVTGKRRTSSGGLKPTEKKRKKVDYGVQATKGRFKRGVLDVSRL